MSTPHVTGSFRDPAGHLFTKDGVVYRQVNQVGRTDYDLLLSSGLYDTLAARGLLIPHEDLGLIAGAGPAAYTVIKPHRLTMVSYPHGWCFSQLQDAALTTLAAQQLALTAGMSLKDASAYNVQFADGKPILIDTLSFERLTPGPWVAYRQFCQHFLAPLALSAYTDERLGRLSQVFIDGVPLRLASRALPAWTWLRRGPLFHIHLHAWGEDRLMHMKPSRSRADVPTDGEKRADAGDMKAAVRTSLQAATRRLRWRPRGEWVTYYDTRESYSQEAVAQKLALVQEWLDAMRPATVWDLGANTGRFSRLATDRRIHTVAFDQDASCVERMYIDARSRGDRHLLPLVMDLANPSPAIGWAHEERASLIQRGPADLVMALALLHHLAIGNNVPFDRIAAFLKSIGRQVIVEFVPKSDPMVRRLLTSRADVFADYSELMFEKAFSPHFVIERRTSLTHSDRVLYWMRTR